MARGGQGQKLGKPGEGQGAGGKGAGKLGKKGEKGDRFTGLKKKGGGDAGDGSGNGPGMGGGGIGDGGEAEENPGQKVGFDKTKIKGQFKKGEILGTLFVKGAPIKGEAKREFTDAMNSTIQESTDALAKEDIPAGYKKLVKDYFDSVEVKELGADGGTEGGAESAPATAPAPAPAPASGDGAGGKGG
ncbi:MAG: hypothetical protein HZA54_15045 [Planctomycetes bacterium]|nr:hypothetical protein [Planctomycetota bacterium]